MTSVLPGNQKAAATVRDGQRRGVTGEAGQILENRVRIFKQILQNSAAKLSTQCGAGRSQ